jgi:hypothetical protein
MFCANEYECMGCSFCSDIPLNDLEKAKIQRSKEQVLRAQGKPTLKVTLFDLLKSKPGKTKR